MPLMQIDHNSEKYHQMVALRTTLLREPLGLVFTQEELDKEKHDMLLGAFDQGKILGCCILTKMNNDTIRLRQMAVLQNQQGKGTGASLMDFSEKLARDMGYRILVMHARDSAIGFYEKCGYRVVGDTFTEVSIPHHVMEKVLR